MYGVNRELYEDIEAAKILGMSEDLISERMSARGERRAFNFLNEGLFRPLKISKDVQNIFAVRASELGVPNPYESAQGIIDSIRDQLSSTSLRGDLFPEIQNPFNQSFLPDITLGPVGQLPPVITGATATPNIIGGQNISLPSQQYNSLYPNDDLAAAYLDKKKSGQR